MRSMSMFIMMGLLLCSFILIIGCSDSVESQVSIAPESQAVQTNIVIPVATTTSNDADTLQKNDFQPDSSDVSQQESTNEAFNFNQFYYPSGWMGDFKDLTVIPDSHVSMDDASCLELSWKPTRGGEGWTGIYWQHPDKNWGGQNGLDLSDKNFNTLKFKARGADGGEKATFKFGGIKGTYSDSVQPAKEKSVTLTSEWVEYAIDLEGEDLSNVIGGFCWEVNDKQCPHGCTIYINSIEFE